MSKKQEKKKNCSENWQVYCNFENPWGIAVWHKSSRMGEILNPCRNLKIFRALVFQEWSMCRVHLAAQVKKFCGSPTLLFMDTQVEAFQVGYSREIEFEVAFGLIFTLSTFMSAFFELMFE